MSTFLKFAAPVLLALPWLEGYVETGHFPLTGIEYATEITTDVILLIFMAVVAKQMNKIKSQNLELERLAMTDGLTGLFNRRTFDHMLEREVERAKRSGKFPSLVFLDVDGFKEINDQQGHTMGDEVLGRVAAAIRGAIRADIDIPCRYGGDEFVVILPETPSAQADLVGGRIQGSLKSRSIGVSVGAVECQSGWESAVCLHQVDVAMYQHKRGKSLQGVST